MRLWPYYRVRKGNWFLDERPKERKWLRNLGILILGAYALFMTANEIYREGAEDGYNQGRLRGYEVGKKEGVKSVVCPRPWLVTLAAPTIID